MPGIYIMSSEPQSGKTIAALGIMEALAGRLHRISVFRPLVRTGPLLPRDTHFKANTKICTVPPMPMPGNSLRAVSTKTSTGKYSTSSGLLRGLPILSSVSEQTIVWIK